VGFLYFSNKLELHTIKMAGDIIFKEKGFPIIKVYESYFEIKAIDFWDFRKFEYSDLKELKIVNPLNNWWYRLYVYTSWAGIMYAHTDPITLKVVKNNGGSWDYKFPNKEQDEFRKIILEINERIKEVKQSV